MRTSLCSAQHFIMLCHGRVTPALHELAYYIPPRLGTAQLLQRLVHPRHLLAKFMIVKLVTVLFESFVVVDALSKMLFVHYECFAF